MKRGKQAFQQYTTKKQNKTKHNKTKQNKAQQNKAKQSRRITIKGVGGGRELSFAVRSNLGSSGSVPIVDAEAARVDLGRDATSDVSLD